MKTLVNIEEGFHLCVRTSTQSWYVTVFLYFMKYANIMSRYIYVRVFTYL